MAIDQLIAIDNHTHLEVSCRNPFDNRGEEFGRAPQDPAPGSEAPAALPCFTAEP